MDDPNTPTRPAYNGRAGYDSSPTRRQKTYEDWLEDTKDMTPEEAVSMCRCNYPITCWVHHDCRDGYCTHAEDDD